MQPIYLDWNATTPPAPEVVDAMTDAAKSLWGNPSSIHSAGRHARSELETTREALAEHLDFFSRDVLFTASGTEANNLALASAETLLTSRLEHPSVVRVGEHLQRAGKRVVWLEVAPSGCVEPADLERQLAALDEPQSAVVAVMAANHETGVLQPLDEIGRITQQVGAHLHVDAVQLVGKGPLEGLSMASSISLTPHKFRGPKGIAALLFRGPPPRPVLLGGAQERGLRPGTQDATAAVGFRVALERALARQQQTEALLRPLRDRLEVACQRFGVVNGAAKRLAHVTNISFSDFPGPELVAALDLAGICVSSGSACSAGTSEPSTVISAMLGKQRAQHAVRFSLGETTTESEIDHTIVELRRLLHPER